MYINIFWILFTSVLTYLFTRNLFYSIQAGFLFGVSFSIIRFTKYALNKEKRSELSIKNKIEIFIIFVFSLLMTYVFINYYYPVYNANKSVSLIVYQYKTMPNKILKSALMELRNHKNSPAYCSLLFFPSLNGASQKDVAKYLVYYKFQHEYCHKYWDWGQHQCSILHNMNSKGHPIELLENIKLCEIAKSNKFQNRLSQEQGYVS